MKKLSLILALLLVVSTFASCKKDDTDSSDIGAVLPPVEYTETKQFISQGIYNGFSYIVYDTHVEIVDYEAAYDQKSIAFPAVIEEKPVTVVNASSLQDNRVITSVTFPETVKEIGNNLLANCMALAEINLPDTVKKIGYSAFFNTPWFDNLTDEFSIVGDGVLIKYNGQGGDVTVPDTVKYISNAFAGNNRITGITVSNSVVGICDYAFYSCMSVTTFSIPSHISDIGSHAFDETSWLFGQTDDFITVGNKVLIAYKGTATDVAVPEGTKYISGAFMNNTEITSVTLPSSLIRIRKSCFLGCRSLTSVIFNNDNTYIEDAAFANCMSLTDIKLPSNLKAISRQMFYSCAKLENIRLPKNVTSIGDTAFYSCVALKSIALPEKTAVIGSAAFFGCTALQSISLPETVKFLGDLAFACCYELTSFTLPPKITEVPSGLLSYCQKIEEITLNENITFVGEGAFEACSDIKVYVAGENTKFHDKAFLDCKGKYKIYCKKGSEAEKFAKKNKIKYAEYKQ